jgi:hypothetical protein
MTDYDKLAIGLLLRAKTVGEEIHILVAQLANEYGIDQRYVEEKAKRRDSEMGQFLELTYLARLLFPRPILLLCAR